LGWNIAEPKGEPVPNLDPELQRIIQTWSGTLGIVSAIIGIVVAGFVLYGALRMKKLEGYAWAMTAAILALIPCVSPCCVIGLPIGIWALIVLLQPEVKAQFH
jgi:type IV secretory pathway VirB2 component (pilin)